MESRIQKLRNVMKDKNLEAVIIYKPQNRRYICGFTGSSGYVLITQDRQIFFTDFRYIQQAKDQCKGFEILEISKAEPVTKYIKEMKISTLGFEDDFMDVSTYFNFTKELENTKMVQLEGLILQLRSIKDENEIKTISKAAQIADKAFEHILKFIKPGVSEKELALELEYFMKKNGALGLSFEPIVASGKRSSLPHGVASEKIIEEGDFLTLDFGCIYNGYCSDMTRTVVVGQASDEQKKIYNIVLEAQIKALEAIRPGITGQELDKIARDYITEKGYGSNFGHGLGHGLGLEVHELPHVNSLGKNPLQPGMIITDEPGIYIPDFGGVRIEDLILVTDDGYKVLSNSPKELIQIRY
ncbi:Xaa-Pro aminopeptidase [Alkalithermobacter thermoalcaliphilus JW-YL-7 = DSM 7308]|uniref:Peptidase M24 n=1 Tax=Alkalithermobacter thermoalcaliphilus JW-YL-7 = DSM 7308 TaxID=1121328 RepID=A0A150FR34_CLOPD|nr:peptidase M24 [[Clostridium] paradoxum JW-YL-7 = DSM 7308]SHL00595.1 Xaa-Pro aminopeptidase [[Clostridium] paradoxum JW-YL-7 = DSM 7308]